MVATIDATEVRRWKRYPEYRQVQSAWLVEVPAHWAFKRLKWTIIACQNGIWGDEPTGEDGKDLGCVRVADFDRDNLVVNDEIELTLRSIQQSKRDGRILRRGDLLLEKSGGGDLQPVGALVLFDSDAEAVCSNFVARVTVTEGYSSSYLRYLHAGLYSARINTRSMKQSTGIQNLDSGQYFDEKTGLPPLEEQQAIAAFLDRETARIDALIGHKERLIALLEEKRQAVISHAVTRGLDPNAKMKYSGVQWRGEVPGHWRTISLRHVVDDFVDYRGRTPNKVDRGVRLVTASNVRDGRIDYDISEDFISEEDYLPWMVRGFPAIGDVLLTTEAPLGETAMVDNEKIALAQRVIMFKVTPSRMTNEYLCLYFQSKAGQSELWSRATGSTAIGIKASHLKGIPVVVPPIDEQIAIAEYVNDLSGNLLNVAKPIRDSIERLQEYRTALISAAVTGQIDVRKEVSAQNG